MKVRAACDQAPAWHTLALMTALEQRCRICETEALVEDWPELKDSVQVSGCACGSFRAEGRFWGAAPKLREEQPRRFANLSRWIGEQNRQGQLPVITLDTWAGFAPPYASRPD